MIGSFSNYLLFGICLAGATGSGIGLVKNLSKRNLKRTNSLISQFIFKDEDGREECGSWFIERDEITPANQSSCPIWEEEDWYKNININNSSMLIRVDSNKAIEAIKKMHYSTDNYKEANGEEVSDEWKIGNYYSCTTKLDQFVKNKSIIYCSKIPTSQ